MCAKRPSHGRSVFKQNLIPVSPTKSYPNAPPLLDCTGPDGADAKTVRESQVAWAKYLGEPSHEKTLYLDKDKKVAIDMVLIPPGKYWRGSPDDVGEESERPQVVITLDQPRWVGKYEVTQKQYEGVLSMNPSTDKKEGEDAAKYPVENVSHVNCMDFATKATTATGTKFRLLTEAEWEYACRAGTRTKWYHSDDEKSLGEIAEFDGKNKSPAKVGGKKPNAFGLHNMSGNVWEWCLDWFYGNYDNTSTTNPQGPASGSIRVHRGGSWLNSADHCRSASRRGHAPDYRPYSLGFRLSAEASVAKGGSVIIQNSGDNPPSQPSGPVSPDPPPAKAPFNEQEARGHHEAWAKHLGAEVVEPNSIGMQLALIPPGEFLMGSSDEDVALALKIAEETQLHKGAVQRIQEERPQHLVRITKPFRLGIHEVTIGQFGKFIEQAGYQTQAEQFGGTSDATKADDPRVTPESKKLNWRTPGQEVGENSPVTQVSWNDAVAFCNWLSEQEKLPPSYVRDGASWTLVAQPQGYRLPTEAEWEYACRAGTTTQYSFGADWKEHDKFGWSNKNAGGRPRGVGLLPANPFGLHDMHGNVGEWCHDGYDGNWYTRSPSADPEGPVVATYRAFRCGSWSYSPANSRSSSRCNDIRHHTPAHRLNNRGFRVALSTPVPPGKPTPAAEPPQSSPAAASTPAKPR